MNSSAAFRSMRYVVFSALLLTTGSLAFAQTNTGLGQDALADITTGTNNTAVGFDALTSATTSS